MKIEYDSLRDLIYIWMAAPGSKSVKTETIGEGVFADFDRDNRLIGIEIIDASSVLGEKVQFEVDLTSLVSKVLPRNATERHGMTRKTRKDATE